MKILKNDNHGTALSRYSSEIHKYMATGIDLKNSIVQLWTRQKIMEKPIRLLKIKPPRMVKLTVQTKIRMEIL